MIDPIDHESQSPYNGYDSNPVLFADPSGASADSDWENYDELGRNRYDRFGGYVPYQERGDAKTEDFFSLMDGAKQCTSVLIDAFLSVGIKFSRPPFYTSNGYGGISTINSGYLWSPLGFQKILELEINSSIVKDYYYRKRY